MTIGKSRASIDRSVCCSAWATGMRQLRKLAWIGLSCLVD